MCLKPEKKSICRLKMSDISEVAKSLLQKYLRLSDLLPDIRKKTAVNHLRVQKLVPVRTQH